MRTPTFGTITRYLSQHIVDTSKEGEKWTYLLTVLLWVYLSVWSIVLELYVYGRHCGYVWKIIRKKTLWGSLAEWLNKK